MASFSIPDVPPKAEITPGTVDAKSGKQLSPHTGAVVFTVNNSTGEIHEGRLSVRTEGEAKPEWFTIDGEPQRDIGTAGSETVKVTISVPAETKPGEYSFRLLVAEESDPDNDYEISQSTAFTVPPAGKVGGGGGGGSKWWLWVLIGLVVLAIIGGVVWFLTRDTTPPPPPPPPTETPTVEPTTAVVPKLEGRTLQEARNLAVEFKLIEQEGPVNGNPPNTVMGQNPGADTTLTKGFPVTVTFDPGVAVPNLGGQTLANATNKILGAGLTQGKVEIRCFSSGVADRIIDQNPKPNDRVEGKRVVTVVLSRIGTTLNPCRRMFLEASEAVKLQARTSTTIKTGTILQPKLGQ
jgi:DNA-directed RNA polymerase subunit N (RpoN/RPB10)